MTVTIHTFSMERFHGDASDYVAKITAERTGMDYCPRCKESHGTIEWKQITNPMLSGPEGERKSAIIAYAICPTTNEPVFIEAWESPE